jgi:hypothetical protein
MEDLMKKISEQQIMEIEKALVGANIPVQMFIGIQNLFRELPIVNEIPKEPKEKEDK